jgi:hypothetical protein
VTQIVLPILALGAIWAFVAAVAGGCGSVVRRRLPPLGSKSGAIAMGDVWIGLAVLAAYLLVWNLILPVTLWTWLVPLAAGGWGAASAARGRPWPHLDRRAILALGAVAVGWALIADQALGPSEEYDFGLYHLDLITYAKHYAALPGLANLHSRLGAGDAHLLLTAFLDQRPLAGAGPHLVDSLLGALLLLDVGLRLARRPAAEAPVFSRRLAALLGPATFVVAAMSPLQRISSPNLDFATFVEVAIGMLYFADSLERDLDPAAALTAVCALGLASATRPLYWALTLFVATFFVAGVWRRSGRAPGISLRAAGLVAVVPFVLAAGWVARQAVLSGYPLYPLTVLGLPTDWRIPMSVLTAANRGDDAWARWPGVDPNVVLGSWHWLGAFWLPKRERDLDVVAPLMLLACVVPSLASLGVRDSSRRGRLGPMLAVAVPCAALLVPWFLIAPDPRFAFAPIWLVPAAVAAWALPPLGRPSGGWWLAVSGLAVLGAAWVFWVSRVQLHLELPAALVVWACLGVAGVLDRWKRAARAVAWGAAFSVVIAGLALTFDQNHPHLQRANGSGPLGLPLPTPPALMPVVTSSGLELTQPVNGADQCYAVMLCVPLLIDKSLHLRAGSVQQGFSVRG